MAGGSIPSNLAPLFVAAGNQYHIPPHVLAGVASVETNLGANRSTSSAGAQGLMQFMPSTAAALGVNVHDDRSSIFGAAKLLNQYGYQSNPLRALGAYNGGPGNPQYGYAHQVMSEAQRLAGALAGTAPAGGSSAPAPASAGSSGGSSGSPGGIDYNSAGIAALMAAANKPISAKGTFKAANVLGSMLNAVNSGKYTTAPSSGSTPSSSGGTAAPSRLTPVSGGSADMNPLHGWNLGRTDMGVDGSANVGAPIRAINDSKVVGVSPNWYAGQPYLLMQLTAGPNAGRYWYVSEQIAGLAPVGSIVRKGDPVAHFAPSGTGIEIGWGSPTPGRTLAQAQGNTGDSSHGNAPAGLDFRSKILGLK